MWIEYQLSIKVLSFPVTAISILNDVACIWGTNHYAIQWYLIISVYTQFVQWKCFWWMISQINVNWMIWIAAMRTNIVLSAVVLCCLIHVACVKTLNKYNVVHVYWWSQIYPIYPRKKSKIFNDEIRTWKIAKHLEHSFLWY